MRDHPLDGLWLLLVISLRGPQLVGLNREHHTAFEAVEQLHAVAINGKERGHWLLLARRFIRSASATRAARELVPSPEPSGFCCLACRSELPGSVLDFEDCPTCGVSFGR